MIVHVEVPENIPVDSIHIFICIMKYYEIYTDTHNNTHTHTHALTHTSWAARVSSSYNNIFPPSLCLLIRSPPSALLFTVPIFAPPSSPAMLLPPLFGRAGANTSSSQCTCVRYLRKENQTCIPRQDCVVHSQLSTALLQPQAWPTMGT